MPLFLFFSRIKCDLRVFQTSCTRLRCKFSNTLWKKRVDFCFVIVTFAACRIDTTDELFFALEFIPANNS